MNQQNTNAKKQTLDDLIRSGAVAEMTGEVAEHMGAFDETALDLDDALAAVADEVKEAHDGAH